MQTWELIFGGAGILGFLGTVLTVLATRRKNKSEIEKLIAETETIRIDAQHKLQEQLNELRDQNNKLFLELDELREKNKKLYVEREEQREAKEKLRAELDRLHKGHDNLRQELQTERERNVYLNVELEKQRIEAKMQRDANINKTIQIEGLEALVAQHEKALSNIKSEFSTIKKQTGQLTAQWEQRKEE